MPLKKDASGKRSVEMELVVSATPEQVWHAMATGPGNVAWFTKATIEEQVGGALRFHFGGMGSSSGEVTIWEPPLRFGYVEHDWSPGAPPVATEITVSALSGGRCVIRMVHSLFAVSDDWDDQLESFEGGWPAFFQVLRLYLKHFPGQEAASCLVLTAVKGDELATWKALIGKLGLAGANVGEERTASEGPEKLAGVVEHVHQSDKQRYVVLRLSAPFTGVALAGAQRTDTGANASLALYAYGADGARRLAASEPKWRAWLTETFGSAS